MLLILLLNLIETEMFNNDNNDHDNDYNNSDKTRRSMRMRAMN